MRTCMCVCVCVCLMCTCPIKSAPVTTAPRIAIFLLLEVVSFLIVALVGLAWYSGGSVTVDPWNICLQVRMQ